MLQYLTFSAITTIILQYQIGKFLSKYLASFKISVFCKSVNSKMQGSVSDSRSEGCVFKSRQGQEQSFFLRKVKYCHLKSDNLTGSTREKSNIASKKRQHDREHQRKVKYCNLKSENLTGSTIEKSNIASTLSRHAQCM